VDPNTVVGWLLIVLGVLVFLVALGIGVRQFVIGSRGAETQAIGPGDILKPLIELLKAILNAPPANAFLVVGLLLVGGGAWVLSARPINKPREKPNAAAVSHVQIPRGSTVMVAHHWTATRTAGLALEASWRPQ
jgi:hypothetical protein